MGSFSLTQQTEALKILYDLSTASRSADGLGECRVSSGVAPGKAPVRPAELMKESRRMKTIAERARDSCFTRLIEILTRLISIEQDVIKGVSQNQRSLIRRKDSVDLKNICLRMALGEGGSRLDRDLRELRDCLRIIVNNLLAYVRDENTLSSGMTAHRLSELSNSFPDI